MSEATVCANSECLKSKQKAYNEGYNKGFKDAAETSLEVEEPKTTHKNPSASLSDPVSGGCGAEIMVMFEGKTEKIKSFCGILNVFCDKCKGTHNVACEKESP